MKIKVAICISSLRPGGAEHVVTELIKFIDNELFEVRLFVLEKRYQTSLEQQIDSLHIPTIYFNKKSGFCAMTILKLSRKLKRFKPDIIHAHLGGVTYSFLYALLARIKIVQTVHTLAQYEYSFLKRVFINLGYRIKKIIPVGVSTEISHSIKTVYKLSKPIITIYNGVNLEKHSSVIRTKIITIGHVGRFEAVKNHVTIINIFKKIVSQFPHLQLILIGDGSTFLEISTKIQSEKLTNKVIIPGYVSNEKINYAEIDLFLMPSIYEGLPLVLIEAMASGCVIIASKVGGISDLIIEGVNGYLVDDPNDVDSFIKKIVEVMNSPQQIRTISKQNIMDSKKYGINQMVHQYQELYRDLASRRVKI